MLTWSEFYSRRLHSSSYTHYFVKQYEPLLVWLEWAKLPIHEIGSGIGSVTRALKARNVIDRSLLTGGFDIDICMVDYSNKNTWCKDFYIDDVFSHEVNPDFLYVSHGVLEHFSDDDIKFILNRYPNSIHYVPLEGWKTPSFGDERLLSYKHWESLIPKDCSYNYMLFNQNKDLVFHVQK